MRQPATVSRPSHPNCVLEGSAVGSVSLKDGMPAYLSGPQRICEDFLTLGPHGLRRGADKPQNMCNPGPKRHCKQCPNGKKQELRNASERYPKDVSGGGAQRAWNAISIDEHASGRGTGMAKKRDQN